MANRVFKESQSYAGTWVMYFILLVEAPTLILLVVLYFTSEEKQEMAIALGVVLGAMALTLSLIFNIKLETRIDNQGISFRYMPFIRKWRKYSRAQVKRWEVSEYQPIMDYGGWGLKGNKTTKAYTVLGTEGLLLDVGEKKKIRIGTMKAKEMQAFMENWMEE
ncbi:hypothetical protein PBT90_14995 [Algoriphagus halophytocola]|uniref:PH domain-containing protein n=1 Tax=Algoriphagus halophytocola TaxID=2991499 RepID=A0ABY6MNG0_9BACT|nr:MULTISPECIES: hypothetical protein [unclassified Algoriphagus]UZD24685.1 hypothetical protein OM944_09330 [Algoriphagus sp. TR-M5]WBL42053.1 hypothetical protein PBT90_14995 [Algoriphagus sp. TR-M9]